MNDQVETAEIAELLRQIERLAPAFGNDVGVINVFRGAQVEAARQSLRELLAAAIDAAVGRAYDEKQIILDRLGAHYNDRIAELAASVPRSRYDACNQDWLDEKERRKQDRARAVAEWNRFDAEVERLQADLAATKRELDRAVSGGIRITDEAEGLKENVASVFEQNAKGLL